MNLLERKMVDALKDMKENHHVVGVKAEFEAEGTRLEEMLRLKEVCMSAGLSLTIKIGGCEALRDMYECRVIGVERLVAPMVETAYALKKFLAAVKMAFPPEEREAVIFAVNIETINGCKTFDEMLTLKEIPLLKGIIMGRVDLTGSLGLTREDINCPQVFEITRELLGKAKQKNLETAIGGGVSAYSLPFFRDLPAGTLDRYETRKVIFGCPGALAPDADRGIMKAVGFELLWLKNKRDYYAMISKEDEQRIGMLEYRYKSLIEAAGGKYE
jgi:4-hydroxy-2-oxoheptanedioate aldolase